MKNDNSLTSVHVRLVWFTTNEFFLVSRVLLLVSIWSQRSERTCRKQGVYDSLVFYDSLVESVVNVDERDGSVSCPVSLSCDAIYSHDVTKTTSTQTHSQGHDLAKLYV